MCNFNEDDFVQFMQRWFGIIIDRSLVGEESIILYKDELDDKLISKQQKGKLPDRIIVHIFSYNEKSEWLAGVLCDENTNVPLVLICIKDGNQIVEKPISP